MDMNESVKTKTNRRWTQIYADNSGSLLSAQGNVINFSASDEAIANRFFAQESEYQVEIHSQQLLNEL
jgi:hypothetical protein